MAVYAVRGYAAENDDRRPRRTDATRSHSAKRRTAERNHARALKRAAQQGEAH